MIRPSHLAGYTDKASNNAESLRGRRASFGHDLRVDEDRISRSVLQIFAVEDNPCPYGKIFDLDAWFA